MRKEEEKNGDEEMRRRMVMRCVCMGYDFNFLIKPIIRFRMYFVLDSISVNE